MIDEVALVARYADAELPLGAARLPDEYYYQSLPLCVIDAVYSIGVRYEGVRRVVARYCDHVGQTRVRDSRQDLPAPAEQESLSTFCTRIERTGIEHMAATVFKNRQRTSTRSGILKAEAVYQFASVLRAHGAEYFQDVPSVADDRQFASEILSIRGQGSGISLQYFWMLAGSDEFVKPDRMILRFLQTVFDRPITVQESQRLLSGATTVLSAKYPHLTPRLLDYVIWEYQRQQPS